MATATCDIRWVKGTRSANGGDRSVEIGFNDDVVGIRDSGNTDSGVLWISRATWSHFTRAVPRDDA